MASPATYTSFEIDWSPDSNDLKTLPRLFNSFDEAWNTARKLMDLYPNNPTRTIRIRKLEHD